MKTNEGYKLIPMSEITDEAREIAVKWMQCDDKNWIKQKHKLASDIMNYAIKYHSQLKSDQKPTQVSAEEFRKFWLKQNPNIIHIPSEHEIGLMEAYAEYANQSTDKKNPEKTIEKVTTKNLDLALRMCGIEINISILDKVIDITELIEEKGGRVTVEDISMLQQEWDKLSFLKNEP